jgi:hypothetical protein
LILISVSSIGSASRSRSRGLLPRALISAFRGGAVKRGDDKAAAALPGAG